MPAKRIFLSSLFCIVSILAQGQTQDDFNTKLSEVYSNAADKKKALALAKELYAAVEKKKDLQTYSNYYLLKNIFENQAPDSTLAKTCEAKAEKLMNAMVGLNNEMKADTSNPAMAWATHYFPALFKNEDPDNANNALAFLNRHPELKNFTNYTYIGYSFERNNDFTKAQENYEEALKYVTDEKNDYHSYLFYTNFLTRTGDYLKADEFIRKMEKLSDQATEFFKDGYRSEAMSARVIYYLNIGDYQSYVSASEKNYEYFSAQWNKSNKTTCDPYPGIKLVNAAFGKEMLREYDAAEKLWKSRDSVNYVWVTCYNKTYPNAKYYPISMYPVYLIKRGKNKALPKPVSFFIKETEDHYNSYSKYADLSATVAKATQLGFLGSTNYPSYFNAIMTKVKQTHDFRESTTPFSNYAYFRMRDRDFQSSLKTYEELFALNIDWINDIIFTFGEKAFVTFYNAKLKEGYDNYHSFVKLAKEKKPELYGNAAAQAYNNLLFTKSISLKGTQKRKEAFLKTNDATITKLYDEWILKKQQLIRQYMKKENPAQTDTTNRSNENELQRLQIEVNRLENELTVKAKDFKKLLKLTPPDWKDIKAKLKEGEAAIEMVRFQWRDQVYYSDTVYYAAYIITKDSHYPEVVYLPHAAADLDNTFYKLYKNNIRLKLDDKDSYNHYWKAINEHLNNTSKIYFSPDGIFHLININTLKNPVTGKYVVDELEIHTATSTADIAFTQNTKKELSTAILIGRPAYKTNTTIAAAVKDETTRSFVNSFRNNSVTDLPGTEEEVLSIKKEMELNKISVKYYLKEQADEEKMYQFHSPGILHIATHGYWSGAGENATDGYRLFNAMVNSGLLLAGVVNFYSSSSFPDTYDGILTAYEAQNLDLEKTSLVVLSACETSLGYLDAGEGVYGLQRAFRAAGAGSIITSLWKVDDAATKDFMITFYQQFLQTKDKADAYRYAQKSIKEKYKYPYFWGAFVMVGE
jgi:CHAT domain-containing protein